MLRALAENTGRKKSPFRHHRSTLSGCIFTTKACIDNRKEHVKQQYLLHVSSYYGELWPTSGWDLLASLGHPSKFQRVSRLGGVTARHCSNGHQLNFAALNRGRHLYSAERPSRWALAQILVQFVLGVGNLMEILVSTNNKEEEAEWSCVCCFVEMRGCYSYIRHCFLSSDTETLSYKITWIRVRKITKNRKRLEHLRWVTKVYGR